MTCVKVLLLYKQAFCGKVKGKWVASMDSLLETDYLPIENVRVVEKEWGWFVYFDKKTMSFEKLFTMMKKPDVSIPIANIRVIDKDWGWVVYFDPQKSFIESYQGVPLIIIFLVTCLILYGFQLLFVRGKRSTIYPKTTSSTKSKVSSQNTESVDQIQTLSKELGVYSTSSPEKIFIEKSSSPSVSILRSDESIVDSEALSFQDRIKQVRKLIGNLALGIENFMKISIIVKLPPNDLKHLKEEIKRILYLVTLIDSEMIHIETESLISHQDIDVFRSELNNVHDENNRLKSLITKFEENVHKTTRFVYLVFFVSNRTIYLILCFVYYITLFRLLLLPPNSSLPFSITPPFTPSFYLPPLYYPILPGRSPLLPNIVLFLPITNILNQQRYLVKCINKHEVT